MRNTRVACIGALCLGASALAGCGGSSASTGSSAQTQAVTTAQRARPTPALSNPDIGTARAQHHHGHAGAAAGAGAGSGGQDAQAQVKITPIKVEKSRPTPATSNDEKSTTGATPLNPCKLVSLSEAQTITGGAVTGTDEAPLGPTCIYKRKGSGGGITLALETQNFSHATHQMRKRSAVTVAGRQAYCGRLGTEMLFVPVGKYQLLNVTAPCAVAQRFAALAMSRLSA